MTDPAPPRPPGRVRVWGLLLRIFHWGLVSGVAVAWVTDHGPPWLHDGADYAALALVCLRVALGFFGAPAERFARFVVGWRATLGYVREMQAGREPRFFGHNPLGGWMTVALLAVVFATGATGWLYTTNAFWGVAWVEDLHGALADFLIILIFVHVAGVAFTSYRDGENLVAAMVHGRKPRTTSRHRGDAIDP